MIEKPKQCHYNADRRTSTLFFDEGEAGEYYLRGGICWPMVVEKDGKDDVQGFAVMIGYNVHTHKSTLFEQREFVTIENIIGDNQRVEFPGIASWFNDCWSKYYAREFYWKQDFETTKTYRLETIRSRMVDPNPQFIELPKFDEHDAHLSLWKTIKLSKIRYEKESELYEQLQLLKKNEKHSLPAIHAFECALMGMERYPWREPK